MIYDQFIMIPYPKLQYTTQTHQTEPHATISYKTLFTIPTQIEK